MRLSELSLQKYGNFAALDLAFGTGAGCIELVVAPNGTGKSVLRQAICELLFGIHPQTPMGFRFGYDGMRIRAQAAADGESFGFVRRKGRLNTLTDPAGAPASPRLLARLPHDRDRARLERLFALDSAQLVEGGQALLRSGGDLADALLSGAGELRPARELIAVLRARRDAVASMRKSGRVPFHEAAEVLKAAQQRLATGLVRPQDWAAKEQKREAATLSRAEANARAQAAAATVARLHRVRGTRRHLDALNHANSWLQANPDAPVLPPDLAERFAAAQQHAAAAQADHAVQQRRWAGLSAQCAALAIDAPALAEEAAIAALAEERGRARQSRNDIPLLGVDLEASRTVIAGLLRQLGSARDPADAAGEIRALADIEAARRLILRHAGLAADVVDGPATAARLHRSIADAEAALAALPPPARTEAVEALVMEITAEGAPAAIADRARRAEAEAAEALRGALARVPDWGRGADALLALPTPGEAELSRLDQAVRSATGLWQQAARQRDREASDVRQQQGLLAEQTAGSPPPDRAAVLDARGVRDKGWRIIHARLEGKPVDPVLEQDFTDGHDLSLAYAAAMAKADAIADRRADEMERLQRIVQLTDAVAEAAQQAVDAQREHDAALQAMQQAQAAWAAACAGIGLPAGAELAEARAFLAARSQVIDAAGQQGRAAAELAAIERRHAGWSRRLAEALGSPNDRLDAQLSAAQLLLQRAAAAVTQRATHRGTLLAAQSSLRGHTATVQEAQDRLDEWSREWEAVLAQLGRAPGEAPETVGPVLDLLIRLEAEIATTDSLKARVAKMQAQLQGFDTATDALRQRLAEPGGDAIAIAGGDTIAIASGDTIAIVEAAMRRLSQAQAQDSRAGTLREQLAAAAADLHRAAEQEQAAAHAVDDMLRLAGATDAADAGRRIALSAQRAAHAEARQIALHRLREDGDGLGPAELQAQADAVPAEALTAQIAAAEAAMHAAQEEAQQAAATEEGLRRDLRALGEADDVARAAADKAAAESRLGRVLEDALVHHTAAAMLEDALRSVEASGDDPRLARIGRAFAALTRGAYDRVSAGEVTQAGKPHHVLLAHEAGDAGHPKQVEELSEGTRDQLYLALRLVAIEDHAATAPPLPFIADDILQTFDDGRALAAFHALLALSVHTQVIVLTHHEHLAVLAASLPDGAVRISRL